MDDEVSRIGKAENATESVKEPSVECLRESKSYENISLKPQQSSSEEKLLIPRETLTLPEKTASIPNIQSDEHADVQTGDASKIKTVFEKTNTTESTTKSVRVESEKVSGTAKEPTDTNFKVSVPPLNFEIKERASEPAQDIFSTSGNGPLLNTGSLYSMKGSPSGRLNRKRDTSSSVFPIGCMGCKDEAAPDAGSKTAPKTPLDAQEAVNEIIIAGEIDSTSNLPIVNNDGAGGIPVTGTGIGKHEGRRLSTKRKDGNPLLGTGYDDPKSSNKNVTRVPPGGYSQGLW